MKVRNYKSGVIKACGQKMRLRAGDRVNVRVMAAGLPCGYFDYLNVPVVSVYGHMSRGAFGNPGGLVRVESNGGWCGFSANAILKIEKLVQPGQN